MVPSVLLGNTVFRCMQYVCAAHLLDESAVVVYYSIAIEFHYNKRGIINLIYILIYYINISYKYMK